MEKINILVADDDVEIVYIIRKILAEKGFNVLEAYNGEEALSLLSPQSVQLVDVFDMSKTATGNAAFNMEELDLVILLNQTIAECDDRLEKSERKLCADIDSDSVLVRTDGSRIYRVFSNLLDNAVKYSLAGTRIFVTLKMYDDRVSVEIMNTSSYEMNFTPERITQRFVRGNSERTGEGSGIGLAIAKTYTEGVGGSFDIRLKGDSFSAVVTLPLEH